MLGIIFDSKLQWGPQVSNSLAIEELLKLVTSNFYSVLYWTLLIPPEIGTTRTTDDVTLMVGPYKEADYGRPPWSASFIFILIRRPTMVLGVRERQERERRERERM